MALVVNTNEEDYTATVEDTEKFRNKVLIVKDSRYPSLFLCKMETGITPSDFNVKFTNLNSAIDYATAYVKDLKITQAAKNVLNQKRRDKNKE
tara:strand:+ start:16224 stop:16502 length:279 start_codon:yes stop_codon:yes gene_type:complete